MCRLVFACSHLHNPQELGLTDSLIGYRDISQPLRNITMKRRDEIPFAIKNL